MGNKWDINDSGKAKRLRIGILGGLGPESTIEYYRQITRAYYDQFHDYNYPDIVICNLPFQPFIESNYRLPEEVEKAIRRLHSAGADFVVASCNSIHIVYEQVAPLAAIPWISIMSAVRKTILQENVHFVGLLGTKCTMEGGFYEKAFHKYGIEVTVPDEKTRERINSIIFSEAVRAVLSRTSYQFLLQSIARLAAAGAEGVILGCTELPLVLKTAKTSIRLFDSTKIHALAALRCAVKGEIRGFNDAPVTG